MTVSGRNRRTFSNERVATSVEQTENPPKITTRYPRRASNAVIVLSQKSSSSFISGSDQTKQPSTNKGASKPRKAKKVDTNSCTLRLRSIDVLFGRGGGTNSHEGNVNFRKICSKYKQSYSEGTRAEKSAIVDKVFEELNELGVAFLEKTEHEKYRTVPIRNCQVKILQALRDRWVSEKFPRPSSPKRKNPSGAHATNTTGGSTTDGSASVTVTTTVDPTSKRTFKKRKVLTKQNPLCSSSLRVLPFRFARAKAIRDLVRDDGAARDDISVSVNAMGGCNSIEQSAKTQGCSTVSTFAVTLPIVGDEKNAFGGLAATANRDVGDDPFTTASTHASQTTEQSSIEALPPRFASSESIDGNRNAIQPSAFDSSPDFSCESSLVKTAAFEHFDAQCSAMIQRKNDWVNRSVTKQSIDKHDGSQPNHQEISPARYFPSTADRLVAVRTKNVPLLGSSRPGTSTLFESKMNLSTDRNTSAIQIRSQFLLSPVPTATTACRNCSYARSEGFQDSLKAPQGRALSLPSVSNMSSTVEGSSFKKLEQYRTWDMSTMSSCGREVSPLFSPIKSRRLSCNKRFVADESQLRKSQFLSPSCLIRGQGFGRFGNCSGCPAMVGSSNGSKKSLLCGGGMEGIITCHDSVTSQGRPRIKTAPTEILDEYISPEGGEVDLITDTGRCVAFEEEEIFEARPGPFDGNGLGVPSFNSMRGQESSIIGVSSTDFPLAPQVNICVEVPADARATTTCPPLPVSLPDPEPLSSVVRDELEQFDHGFGEDEISLFDVKCDSDNHFDLHNFFVQTGYIAPGTGMK